MDDPASPIGQAADTPAPSTSQAPSGSQLPVVDESIDNVAASTSRYLAKHPWYVIIPLIVAIALDIGLIIMQTPVFVAYLLPFLLPVFGYNLARKKIQHEFMQQFAAANGFSYGAKGSLDGLDGAIFRIGRSRKVWDVVNGRFQNYPISLFTYQYTIGFGKSERTLYYTIFELQFDITLPDMLLENASLIFEQPLSSTISGHGKEFVKLEGDFNKYFSLSIPKGYEIEALEIFTPDVMAELIDKAKGFSLEIVNNHMFIYDDGMVSTKQKLYDFYALAQYFIEKLGPVLARMKPSTEAMEEVMAARQNPSSI
jgi:hypothetical protein